MKNQLQLENLKIVAAQRDLFKFQLLSVDDQLQQHAHLLKVSPQTSQKQHVLTTRLQTNVSTTSRQPTPCLQYHTHPGTHTDRQTDSITRASLPIYIHL